MAAFATLLMSSYYVPGSVMGAADTKGVKQSKILVITEQIKERS